MYIYWILWTLAISPISKSIVLKNLYLTLFLLVYIMNLIPPNISFCDFFYSTCILKV